MALASPDSLLPPAHTFSLKCFPTMAFWSLLLKMSQVSLLPSVLNITIAEALKVASLKINEAAWTEVHGISYHLYLCCGLEGGWGEKCGNGDTLQGQLGTSTQNLVV